MSGRVNPGSSSTLLKVALFGGAGFLAYKYLLPQLTAGGVIPPNTIIPPGATNPAPTGGAAPPPPAPPTPPAPPVATPPAPAANAYNSLAALLDRMTKAASSMGWSSQSPDQWNWLMVQQGGPNPAPDPLIVFSGRDAMTLAQYWAGMSAYLARTQGLSGMGIYAGLGRLAFGGGR